MSTSFEIILIIIPLNPFVRSDAGAYARSENFTLARVASVSMNVVYVAILFAGENDNDNDVENLLLITPFLRSGVVSVRKRETEARKAGCSF